jgi:hypothetical protein
MTTCKPSTIPVSLLLIMVLAVTGCAKKVDVHTPQATLTTTDRVMDVLNSDLPPEQKVQIIHDLLDREQNRGQNLTSSWKETLAWLSTVITVLITK